MVQSLNPKAIYTFVSVVLRRPNVIIPHISVPNVSYIDFVALKQYTSIRAIIFDKDHTITLPYNNEQIHSSVQKGLQQCIQVFGIQNVAIFSNSVGTDSYDPNYHQAQYIEQTLGIPVIRHIEKKPGGIKEVLQHFTNRNTNNDSTNNIDTTTKSDGSIYTSDQLCIIGDRLLTDVVFGNIHHMVTIHTQPLSVYEKNSSSSNNNNENEVVNDRDNWTAKVIRPIENKILYRNYSSNSSNNGSTFNEIQQLLQLRNFFTKRKSSHPALNNYASSKFIVNNNNENDRSIILKR